MIKDLHYSTELEKALLGAILLEPTAFGRMYGILTRDVFYHDHHKVIFQNLNEMWEDDEQIDCLTLCYKMNKRGMRDIGGNDIPYYITSLTNAVKSTAHLETHSLILRQMYIDREMIAITSSGTSGKDGLQVMKEIEERMLQLKQFKNNDDFKSLGDVLMDLYTHMDVAKNKEMSGITTGFKEVDKITGGLEPGGMYIVAARPSVGKSAFMGQMVLGAAKNNHQVGIISLEMEDIKIMARMASIVTDVEYWRINRNRMYDETQSNYFYKKIGEMSNLPIRISDNAQVNIGDIKSKVARLKQRGQIDILFIDYLGLIDTEGSNRNENREREVSRISRGIKLMAMQYSIPIVILCQLNRASAERGDKPKLHNLRESGSLEQDADGVLFLHRDFMSGKKVNDEGGSTESEADIIIAKWRNGELADLKIGFDGPKMKFYELNNTVNGFTKIEADPF